MTLAQRRNCLTTHFSECIPVVKRRISLLTCYVMTERGAQEVQVHVFFTPALDRNDWSSRPGRFNPRQELQVPTEWTAEPTQMFGRSIIPSPAIEIGFHGRSVRSLVTTLIAT
jgi:hypothetical protein